MEAGRMNKQSRAFTALVEYLCFVFEKTHLVFHNSSLLVSSETRLHMVHANTHSDTNLYKFKKSFSNDINAFKTYTTSFNILLKTEHICGRVCDFVKAHKCYGSCCMMNGFWG